MSPTNVLFRPESLTFLTGGLAIVVGGLIVLVRSFLQHRERMAMIRSGMHPDLPADSEAQVTARVKQPAAKEKAWSDWAPPQN